MANILYIHGYGSSGLGDTATAIKRYLPEDYVIAPSLNYQKCDISDVERACKKIDEIPYKIDAIIASSFGGYIATLIANCRSELPVLLINPCLRPQIWMPKLTGMDCYLQDAKLRNVNTIIVEGLSDEVLNDYQYARSICTNIVELPEQCHRLEPHVLQSVVKMFRQTF